jgi:predicted TIM-barrel fold metal-dependent hydrolase
MLNLKWLSLSKTFEFRVFAAAAIGISMWAIGFTTPRNTSAASPAAISGAIPFIDAHTHMDQRDPTGSEKMLATLQKENAAKIFLLVPPYSYQDPALYDTEPLMQIARSHPDKIAVLGGGGSLNAMIQQSVQTGDAGPDVREKFKKQAEKILSEGAIGFGELTTEHFPSAGSALYQYAPVDHPLLLLLADIAAQHGAPIELHIEAVPRDMATPSGVRSPPAPARLHENVAPLERLLEHNTRAKIVWAHVGSDNTGYRTPELCRRLLKMHQNLYMEIKIDPLNPGKNPPLVDGKIPAPWLKLFEDFPDRFILGSDQHYPEPPGTEQRWEALATLLNQLPAKLQKKIGMTNALHIYNQDVKRD